MQFTQGRANVTLPCPQASAMFNACFAQLHSVPTVPLLAIVPLPPAVVCIVLPVKSVDGFRRVRTVLGPMASLSALQGDILVGLSPCLCPSSSCHLCPWNPFPFSCSCFASNPSRGDRIFRTFGTSCHRAVAVRRSPSVLCSSHWLHDASGNCCPCTRHIHKLLSQDGPRLESLRIQQQVRRKLCVRHSVQKTIPTRKPSDIFSPKACSYNARSRSYASSFASMSPEKSNWSRLKSCPAVLDLMCGSYLSTNSCQARSPSVDLVFTTRSGPGPEVLCRSK